MQPYPAAFRPFHKWLGEGEDLRVWSVGLPRAGCTGVVGGSCSFSLHAWLVPASIHWLAAALFAQGLVPIPPGALPPAGPHVPRRSHRCAELTGVPARMQQNAPFSMTHRMTSVGTPLHRLLHLSGLVLVHCQAHDWYRWHAQKECCGGRRQSDVRNPGLSGRVNSRRHRLSLCGRALPLAPCLCRCRRRLRCR